MTEKPDYSELIRAHLTEIASAEEKEQAARVLFGIEDSIKNLAAKEHFFVKKLRVELLNDWKVTCEGTHVKPKNWSHERISKFLWNSYSVLFGAGQFISTIILDYDSEEVFYGVIEDPNVRLTSYNLKKIPKSKNVWARMESQFGDKLSPST